MMSLRALLRKETLLVVLTVVLACGLGVLFSPVGLAQDPAPKEGADQEVAPVALAALDYVIEAFEQASLVDDCAWALRRGLVLDWDGVREKASVAFRAYADVAIRAQELHVQEGKLTFGESEKILALIYDPDNPFFTTLRPLFETEDMTSLTTADRERISAYTEVWLMSVYAVAREYGATNEALLQAWQRAYKDAEWKVVKVQVIDWLKLREGQK